MKKSYLVSQNENLMRLDRWIRNNIENLPQSLLEKNKGKFDIFSIFGKGTEVCLYFNKFIK